MVKGGKLALVTSSISGFQFVEVGFSRTTVDWEAVWDRDILDEPGVDIRPVHLGVGGGGHNLHGGPGDGVTLGDPLRGGYDVVYVLPHGEQMRGHCGLQSPLGFLPPCPRRLSSIENIIWGNNI